MNKFLLALILTLLAGTAFASNVRFGPRGESLPVLRLTTLVSDEGEDKNAFLGRAGRFLHNYTANNGYEACASICKASSGNRWGVAITTNESHIGCLVVDVCPTQTPVNTTEGIHSHPMTGAFEVNAADQLFNKLRGREVRRQSTSRVYQPTGFSDVDRAAGPGYLVEGEQLLYFDGRSEQVIAPLPAKVFPHSPD